MKVSSFLLFSAFVLATSSFSYGESVHYLSPRTKIPARGISLVSPDEKGWFVFDPDGKGSSLVKSGPTKSESYAITITYMQSTGLESEKEFLDTVKQKTGSSDERFKIREKNEGLDRSRGTYFANYYSLSEDHGAHQMPKEKSFALLEMMGFYARHPNDPTRIIRVEYSYRYYPGHEDPEFKKKGEWVLNHATFTKP